MKRIIAVHDISGYGRCALTVVLPILGVMGVRACPLPTAYLSAHTGFPAVGEPVFLDLTAQMAPTLEHWDALQADFDGFYSGFLGSEEQIGLLIQTLSERRKTGFTALVDPVMGDGGKPYRTYTPAMCRKMAELVDRADIITPNLTEGAILLGEDYDPAPGWEKVCRWLNALSGEGKRSVILTGVSTGEGTVGAAVLDRESGNVTFPQARLVPGQFSGTGDIFASVVLGELLNGKTIFRATERAVDFISQVADVTWSAGGDPVEGAWFEPLLATLAPGAVPTKDVALLDPLGL